MAVKEWPITLFSLCAHKKNSSFHVLNDRQIILIHEVGRYSCWPQCNFEDYCWHLHTPDEYIYMYTCANRARLTYLCMHAYGAYLSFLLSFGRLYCIAVWLFVINQRGSRASHTNYWNWPSSIINAKSTQPHSNILKEKISYGTTAWRSHGLIITRYVLHIPVYVRNAGTQIFEAN